MCLICDRIQMIKDEANPFFVKELETGYVVLGDTQRIKGYTLFLCKKHETELFDLDEDFAAKYMKEMIFVAKAVKNAFCADKINYECLGQGDALLHWHLFPRHEGDLGNYGITVKARCGGFRWRSFTLMRIVRQKKNCLI